MAKHGTHQFIAWVSALGLSTLVFASSYKVLVKSKLEVAGGHHEQASAINHSDGHHETKEDEHGITGKSSDHGEGLRARALHAAPHNKEADHGRLAASHDKTDSTGHSTGEDHNSNAPTEKRHADSPGRAKKQATKDSHTAHWSYNVKDHLGPQSWGKLDASYYQCEKGHKQSPIDLVGTRSGAQHMPNLSFHYPSVSSFNVINNGHTIQANAEDKSAWLELNGKPFKLIQFHFHAPSEHKVKGVPFDLELHLVHKSDDGRLAVVGVLLHEKSNAEHATLKPIWDLLPLQGGQTAEGIVSVEVPNLLPTSKDFFHYEGSLTTPPCSEGVKWFVMKQPVAVSGAQIDMYDSIFKGPTNRPIQPLNARTVEEGSSSKSAPLAH